MGCAADDGGLGEAGKLAQLVLAFGNHSSFYLPVFCWRFVLYFAARDQEGLSRNSDIGAEGRFVIKKADS